VSLLLNFYTLLIFTPSQPDALAIEILNPLQLEVLKAAASKNILTVAWAVESVAFLVGGSRTSS
jgi:hypothetical protein